jgi:hypothetical protein
MLLRVSPAVHDWSLSQRPSLVSLQPHLLSHRFIRRLQTYIKVSSILIMSGPCMQVVCRHRLLLCFYKFTAERFGDTRCWSSSILSPLSFNEDLHYITAPTRSTEEVPIAQIIGSVLQTGQLSSIYRATRSIRVFGQAVDVDSMSYLCLLNPYSSTPYANIFLFDP